MGDAEKREGQPNGEIRFGQVVQRITFSESGDPILGEPLVVLEIDKKENGVSVNTGQILIDDSGRTTIENMGTVRSDEMLALIEDEPPWSPEAAAEAMSRNARDGQALKAENLAVYEAMAAQPPLPYEFYQKFEPY
jgi:hypothetical protein